ncbi:helix-turn-helix domain-containing protein [Streptomyces lonegramiae]|uniref:Helix-turn-helix transcriptional regulator n=1 Tax=Streptomyces lonegramiae TaxID=3075524 RepID=A0ABU2XUN4_9ACTN|nr:helix-turn-helix transcriptional regulator [Streptomyces sp. DSM 41529]MDT0549633.1 helix-turn-helix transcriptional regulator [Streptomyces sp. DSM 41529]
MAARRGATFRRRELGKELRRLREKNSLTILEAAEGLGFSDAKLSRVETGLNGLPRVADMEKLLDRYGVTDVDDRESLLTLHRESLTSDWWRPYRSVMPSGLHTYVGLEMDARAMRSWQSHVIFGLLQAESYARALFMTAKPVDETTTEFVEHNTRVRMERKEIITREDSPVELRVILDESALRRVVGDPKIMREQYETIAELCQLDNVTVQVLPLSLATYRATDNFIILDFDSGVDSVVGLEYSSVSFTDKKSEVWKYNRRFDAMREGALPPTETPRFLTELARELG